MCTEIRVAIAAQKFPIVILQISSNLPTYTISTYDLKVLFKSRQAILGFLLKVSQDEVFKVLVRLNSYLETWRKIFLEAHSGCWQSPNTCNCRCEVPVSLPAVTRDCSSAPISHLHSFQVPFIYLRASNNFCPPARKITLFFKGFP